MIQARKLRIKKYLDEIPDDKPGYYKWWAKKKEFNELLKGLGTNIKGVINYIEEIDSLYCIYVGTAIKESLQKRLDWHVNDKHTDRAVRNGVTSTLRQSIASVICHNQYDKDGTNCFIDKLYVEWFPINCKIKSEDAIIKISNKEKKLINQYLRILNIKDNNHREGSRHKKTIKRIKERNKMKIALIGCVKQKANKPQKARELYISPLFVKSLEYAEKINVDKIYVLSAKYGLVPIDKVIEPYEKTLNNMKKNERVEWANEVLSELSKVSDTMKDEYYILAGKNYYENIYKRLKNVKIVMEGLQLGQRLQFLNKELS